MRGLVIAGTGSGVGKTVATLAVLSGLAAAGHDVRAGKAGPDFIDPRLHERVTDAPSRTLDPWLQGEDGLRRTYERADGDLCVVEGMMGLYDGTVSSTAAVAEALSLPVVLVVDASGGMESVAATALGFRAYAAEAGADVDVVGVIAQRARGGTHERGIREALPEDLAYLGRIPPDDALEVPERHLGLRLDGSAGPGPAALASAAEHVALDRLVALAREPPSAQPAPAGAPLDLRVAVARDDAFRFCYPTTIEHLRTRASVVSFSPVAGDDLPPCDGVYLPGGYPECFAAELSSSPALASLARRAADGLPVMAECGGMIALGRSLAVDGETHPMAGVLPAEVRMHDRPQAIDHVALRSIVDAPTAAAGQRLCGHEFHHSSATVDADARFAFAVERGRGITGDREGLLEHETVGTYCHVHPESGAFDAFLASL